MSNLLYMDESNGNGVYAAKSNTTATATTSAATNNINNIMMTATTTAAAAAAATLPTSVSNEDLSQSLSEYTDADESISAPTEFLAEFLSAVMLKDYKKALKYCKLILQYEPHNATAKEFYPLILDKLRGATSSDSDENYNKSSSPELVLELQSSDPSAGESDEAASDDQRGVNYVEDGSGGDEFGLHEDNYNSSGEPHSQESNVSSNSSCGSAGASLSESVEEEDEEEDDVISSSGDDLPVDDHQHLMGTDGSGAADGGTSNGSNNSSRNSSSGGGRSRSDNTTHSYSSLLLEEEDDIVPVHLHFPKDLSTPDLDVSNGNKIPSTSCSDSESPTEPLTQRLAAILRSKCGVSNNDPQY